MISENKQAKKVNVLVQCIASLFVPTAIYGFYRIKKGKIGILLISISYVLYILGNVSIVEYAANNSKTLSSDSIGLFSLITTILVIMSFILPVFFMYVWSKEYNSKIK